jgi:IS30 family transposase
MITRLPGAWKDVLGRRDKGRFKETFKSITMDSGSEFLDSGSLERSRLKPREKRTECYYTHSYSAQEKGRGRASIPR